MIWCHQHSGAIKACEDITSLRMQVKRKKRRAPSSEPCGTPLERMHGADVDFLFVIIQVFNHHIIINISMCKSCNICTDFLNFKFSEGLHLMYMQKLFGVIYSCIMLLKLFFFFLNFHSDRHLNTKAMSSTHLIYIYFFSFTLKLKNPHRIICPTSRGSRRRETRFVRRVQSITHADLVPQSDSLCQWQGSQRSLHEFKKTQLLRAENVYYWHIRQKL